MKIAITLLTLLASISIKADLVLQTQEVMNQRTNVMTVKICGNKLRTETQGMQSVFVVDMVTLDDFELYPKSKTFQKTSGQQIKTINQMQKPESSSPSLVKTGQSEKVGGYEADIYIWSHGNHPTNVLWVAKDFPHFDSLKPYLAKLDQYHHNGPGRNSEPIRAELPGMVVKRKEIMGSSKFMNESVLVSTLISAVETNLDASEFEVPADYKNLDD
jgi:hypothetical protein